MSCPDWPTLTGRREQAADDPAGWQEALTHLDDCPQCQRDAPAADLTLLFRRLPVLETDRDGVEAMKLAVASMRRGEVIERRRDHGRRKAIRQPLLRAAALAAVLLGTMALRGAGVPPPAEADLPVLGPAPAVAVAESFDLSAMPLVETIDPIYSSIIQVVDDDISLVVVMPTHADV